MNAYDVLEPEVLGVIFPALITTVAKDSFYLVFFLILDVGVDIIAILILNLLFKPFKISNVINVVGYLCTSTGDADFVRR